MRGSERGLGEEGVVNGTENVVTGVGNKGGWVFCISEILYGPNKNLFIVCFYPHT